MRVSQTYVHTAAGKWLFHITQMSILFQLSRRSIRSTFEADVAVNLLESEGIPAHARGNDIVGIVGPGFQGPTSPGVDVMVPSPLLARALKVMKGAKGG